MSNKKREYWEDHIKNWKKSNKSIHKFCKENNLIPSTFNRWLDKLNQKVVPIKLELPLESRENHNIVIEFNSLKISIPLNVETTKLQTIIREVRRCS